VDAKSTDISTSLAGDPEDGKVTSSVELEHLGFVNGTDSQSALDGGNERRTLVQGTTESLEGTLNLGLIDFLMETRDGDVLLTGSLLGLDETSGTLNADNQATSDLRVEGTTVTGLLNLQDLLNPGNDL
jgi:hypothetical protein